MRKLVLVIASGALGAVGILGAGAAQASCDQGAPAAGHEDVAVAPGTGSHIYTDGGAPGSTSGYVGLHGSVGYLEGDVAPFEEGASVEGATPDGSIDGKATSEGRVCVNDTVIL